MFYIGMFFTIMSMFVPHEREVWGAACMVLGTIWMVASILYDRINKRLIDLIGEDVDEKETV